MCAPSNMWFPGPTQLSIPNCILIGTAVLHSSRQGVPILHKWSAISPPQNCQFALGISTPILHMVPWAHLSFCPKQHLKRFSHFCRAHDRDRPTDHTTASVTICHIYIVLECSLIINNVVACRAGLSGRQGELVPRAMQVIAPQRSIIN